MTPAPVVISGLGLVTPAGVGVPANWDRVLAGRSTAVRPPQLAGLPVDFACVVPDFDADILLGRRKTWMLDRHAQFAVVAAREAVGDAGLDIADCDPNRVAVIIGTGAGGTITAETQHRKLLETGAARISALTLPMALPNMATAQVAIDLGAHGPSMSVATACASGATAIGLARDLLRFGVADVAVAGGTDAAVTPYFAAAFARMKALSTRRHDPAGASRPFDVERDGFVMAEGAGVVVLETEQHAHGRGVRPRTHLLGYGASTDAYHATTPAPDGAGVERAMRAALADAGLGSDDIGHVNAHGTSTPLNDVTEAAAVRRVLGRDTVITSTKGVTGHPLGAAGAIEAVYTVLALRHGLVPPTANVQAVEPAVDLDVVVDAPRKNQGTAAVSNSFGFGGHNTALVIAVT
ncbi:beta-ketoacyl-[acyl-carrier-protein] synthase family protein [Micromonospora sp. WMMD735]|uniref:beta-ketoacyl-[acyl-carrier-protein] synthase family protein n=1 Tax=Micromonospora sp. WMMD735 TaxID=3404130 RepID=UPI003B9436C2